MSWDRLRAVGSWAGVPSAGPGAVSQNWHELLALPQACQLHTGPVDSPARLLSSTVGWRCSPARGERGYARGAESVSIKGNL